MEPRTRSGKRPRMHLRSHDPYRPNSASAAPRLPRRAFFRRRDSDDDVEAEGSDSAGSIADGGSRFNIMTNGDHVRRSRSRQESRRRLMPGTPPPWAERPL